jgi:hypothetical protein
MLRVSIQSPSIGHRVGSPIVSDVMAWKRLVAGVIGSCLVAAACGEADLSAPATVAEAAVANGEPDCGGDQPWVAAPDIDPDFSGDPTAEAALRPFLEQWQQMFGGTVVMIGSDRAALIVDRAEVVVADTMRTNPGGFAVNGSTGCDGFEPDVLPGLPSAASPNPATIPAVSVPSSPTATTHASNTASTLVPTPSTFVDSALVPRLADPLLLDIELVDEPAARLDPAPPDLDPTMSADEVADRFRPHLEATSARPASRLVVRFAVYTGIDWQSADANTPRRIVEKLPVWVVVAEGLQITPSCPAPTIPSDTEHCAPIAGYGMIIAADHDGHEISATWRNGTAPDL